MPEKPAVLRHEVGVEALTQRVEQSTSTEVEVEALTQRVEQSTNTEEPGNTNKIWGRYPLLIAVLRLNRTTNSVAAAML